MTAIQNATQRIAETLRLQIATLAESTATDKSRKHRKSAENERSSDKPPKHDFAERIALLVQGVSVDDPPFQRKVLRIFLESVISAELGASLASDVRFAKMIDSVQQQMESDPELAAFIKSALTSLVTQTKADPSP